MLSGGVLPKVVAEWSVPYMNTGYLDSSHTTMSKGLIVAILY